MEPAVSTKDILLSCNDVPVIVEMSDPLGTIELRQAVPHYLLAILSVYVISHIGWAFLALAVWDAPVSGSWAGNTLLSVEEWFDEWTISHSIGGSSRNVAHPVKSVIGVIEVTR